MFARSLYHRLVPEEIRAALAARRRRWTDRLRRTFGRAPYPPIELLIGVQCTPYLDEYLEIGRRSASSVISSLRIAGFDSAEKLTVVELGITAGRTLRFLRKTDWTLVGWDYDPRQIRWARENLRFATFEDASDRPRHGLVADAVVSLSLFTHLDASSQRAMAGDLTHIVRQGGCLVVSTLGESRLKAFPKYDSSKARKRLAEFGAIDFKELTLHESTAFHTPKGIAGLFAGAFELVLWIEKGLDGVQDLAVLRRRRDARNSECRIQNAE